MNEEIEIEKRLARQYRRVAHRHKGLVRFPDEFKSKEQLKKEEQEKGYRYLSNQDADTMVCDGAKLNLFSFSYNLKIYYENKKIKNVCEKIILKMDNDLELTEKVEVKGKEKE